MARKAANTIAVKHMDGHIGRESVPKKNSVPSSTHRDHTLGGLYITSEGIRGDTMQFLS